MTVKTYASIINARLLPEFGTLRLEDVTSDMIEDWLAGTELAPSSRMKAVMVVQGIFKRATRLYGLPSDPIADVERPSIRASGAISVFDPDEVWQLVRSAASEQDAAIYLTAAFTGLRRGELIVTVVAEITDGGRSWDSSSRSWMNRKGICSATSRDLCQHCTCGGRDALAACRAVLFASLVASRGSVIASRPLPD